VLTLADAYWCTASSPRCQGGGTGWRPPSSRWPGSCGRVRAWFPVLGAIMIAQFPLDLAAIATFTRSSPPPSRCSPPPPATRCS
jgi:hypothetical protein